MLSLVHIPSFFYTVKALTLSYIEKISTMSGVSSDLGWEGYVILSERQMVVWTCIGRGDAWLQRSCHDIQRYC